MPFFRNVPDQRSSGFLHQHASDKAGADETGAAESGTTILILALRNCANTSILSGVAAGARILPVALSVPFTNEFGELHPMIRSDHLGGLLTDHDARCIRVAADHLRHDARIRYPQLLRPEDP